MSATPVLGVRTQLEAYRKTLRRQTWLSIGASALLCLTAIVPLLLPEGALAPGLRVVVGLASAALIVASVLATRALRARIADSQFLGADWTQYARDLKERADHDPAARAEYVAYLRDARELLHVPAELKRSGVVSDQQLSRAFESIDAEIPSYERALGPEGAGTEAR